MAAIFPQHVMSPPLASPSFHDSDLLHLNLHLTLRQRRWRGCAAIYAFSAELNVTMRVMGGKMRSHPRHKDEACVRQLLLL